MSQGPPTIDQFLGGDFADVDLEDILTPAGNFLRYDPDDERIVGSPVVAEDILAALGYTPADGGDLDALAVSFAAHNHDSRYARRADNLSDLADTGTARMNLGLGTAATEAESAFARLLGRAGGQTLNLDTASGGSGTINSTAHATKGPINLNGGAVVIGSDGWARFTGAFTENTTTPGLYTGIVSGTPRVLFADGTNSRNWQIDNANGTFRWLTPGTVQMSLTTASRLTITSINLASNYLIDDSRGINLHGNATRPAQVPDASLLVGFSQTDDTNRATGNVYAAGSLILPRASTPSGTRRNAATIDAVLSTLADASWQGRLVLSAGDYNGLREGIRIDADGTRANVTLLSGTLYLNTTPVIGMIATGVLGGGYIAQISSNNNLINGSLVGDLAFRTQFPYRIIFSSDSGGSIQAKIDTNGRWYNMAPNSAPTDADLPNSMMTAWLDESAGKMKWRVRKSDGTYATAELAYA